MKLEKNTELYTIEREFYKLKQTIVNKLDTYAKVPQGFCDKSLAYLIEFQKTYKSNDEQVNRYTRALLDGFTCYLNEEVKVHDRL